tara:strand:- start:552 stop:935 length:384 start_codon:yes stop_codon:yes gene_type:complete
MKNSIVQTVVLVTLPFLLGGCLFSNRRVNAPIRADAVEQLVPNQSTAADVAAALGAPTDVVQLGHKSAWRYDHIVEKQTALVLILFNLRGVDTDADRVWVFFDPAGVVTHVAATFEAGQAEYDLPIF